MNYRKKFENFYRIKIPEGYEIHHIDGDRENNRIGNLLMLPKKLHHQYHWWKDRCVDRETGNLKCTTNIGDLHRWRERENINSFLDALEECDKWYVKFFNKRQLLFAAGMYDFSEG